MLMHCLPILTQRCSCLPAAQLYSKPIPKSLFPSQNDPFKAAGVHLCRNGGQNTEAAELESILGSPVNHKASITDRFDSKRTQNIKQHAYWRQKRD